MVALVRHERRRGASLARRSVAVSLLVSAIIGAAFGLLALAIDGLRDSEARANHALEVLNAANRLERLLVDVETTERGFVITGAPEFLSAWSAAQRRFISQVTGFEQVTQAGDSAAQGQRGREIVAAGTSYIRNYSVSVVEAWQRDPASARTLAVTLEGKHQLDALRMRFQQFMDYENQIFKAGQQKADSSANLALGAASAGVAASIVLILLSGGYLNRSVVRPVRRASGMAGRMAGGDLTVRMPETGPAEVGDLQRSFNSMADSLDASHEDLRHTAGELAASRARVVAAADETRRRIERDLHDGTQQRLISLALQLRVVLAAVPPEQRKVAEQWSRVLAGLTEVIDELREITRGLHPAILETGGLGPALRALARRAMIPVDVSVQIRGRLPKQVEAAVYYVVSEALTNAAKYARASVAQVDVDAGDMLRLLVRDDGVGGADASRGSGLIGLMDRVEAVGGRLEITSPRGSGTTLAATIPVQAAGQA